MPCPPNWGSGAGRDQTQRVLPGLNPHRAQLGTRRRIGNRETHLRKRTRKLRRRDPAAPRAIVSIRIVKLTPQPLDRRLDRGRALLKRRKMVVKNDAPLSSARCEITPNDTDGHLRGTQLTHQPRPPDLTNRVVAIPRLLIDQRRTQQVVLVIEAQRAARQTTPRRELSNRQQLLHARQQTPSTRMKVKP